MTLIKTSVLTAVATVIKVIAGFFINKVIALYAGPAGLALVGQLQNFSSIMMTFANGAITQGIIKYTAEYREDIEEKSKFFSNAIIITLTCSLVIGIFLNVFSSYLSETILKSSEYSSVFIIFGFTIILFSLNTLLMSILNGEKEIKKFIIVNILSNLILLLITSLLIYSFGLIGALYALVTNQSLIFFVTLSFVLKSSWFNFKYFKKGFDKKNAIKLGKYSLMALTTAITLPVSHLIIRNYIGETISWDAAGYWQGIWYISSMYLMVITASLSVYYLPRLSEIKNNKELKKEIINGYKIIIPIVTILALGIYLFRELIITIAFSEKFIPMLNLFKWQLIGDVIKIISWLLSYVLLAKAMTRIFIYTEILFNTSFVIGAYIFIKYFGLIGITYAYSLNYLLYLAMMVYIFRKKFI